MASIYAAIQRLHPTIPFELVQDGSRNNEPYIAVWGSDTVPEPTPEEIAASLAALEAEEASERQAAQQLRENVRALALSAVGVRYDQLTTAQRNALLVAVLWRMGMLDRGGRVRAFEEWR